MTVPVAITEILLRYFGHGALPDFSSTPRYFAQDPYRPLREFFQQRWQIDDITDDNYDVSFRWVLTNHPERLTVRLSVVGPYAILLRNGTQLAADPTVDPMLAESGFCKLDEATLSMGVSIWEPEYSATLYEFLFEFDNGLPWEN